MTKPKVSAIVSGILDFLDSQKALDLLPEIISGLKAKANSSAGTCVESAVALSDQEKKDITAVLSQNYSLTTPVDFKINPRLVGGLRISLGDRVIDASVQARMEDLYAG